MVEPVPVEAVAVVGVDPVQVAADMHPAREAVGSLAVERELVDGSLVVLPEFAGMEPALLEAVGRVVGSLLERYHIADLLVAHHTHLVDKKTKIFC